MPPICNGVCHRFNKPSTGLPGNRYTDGIGRCKTCDRWVNMELDSYNNRCNCCKSLIRRHAKITMKAIRHKRY